jgi:2-oxoglutarate/2-oxoacid ferredoxin oxidoreductase subunit alpha
MSGPNINIMIGGEAGQGLVTIGQALAKALVRAGYFIVVTQSYMSRIRGGHNTFSIRVSSQPLDSPTEGVDLLLALNQETLELHRDELRAGSRVLADSGLSCATAPCLNVPYAELAEARYLNTVALGAAACLLGLEQKLVAGALDKLLGKHSAEVTQANHEALAKAYAWAWEQAHDFEALAPPAESGSRLMMNGNEALAMGLLAGGLKFLSFYPMTPSTSIALNIIANAEKMGVAVEQAEDEISAINMALGASYAGAPALVTTSGGGYALMTEGLSLAGMSETPVVIALVMRPGPATGLPTRSEQGDLSFALHGGHGEFPRAILTPGSVEECFAAGHQALHLAEDFQSPVFILSDQFLADSHRAVEPFGLEELSPVRPGTTVAGPAYQRYQVTGSGVSPRALPGSGPGLVVADGDEHDQAGHITEDLELRVLMQDKRLRKAEGLKLTALAPEFSGPEEADLLLVSWGSSKGPVAAAARALRDRGRAVAACHFPQVWPLAPEKFLPRFGKAQEVVLVEGNATGQFAGVLASAVGFRPHRLITRYDGLHFTPEYILRALAQ